MLLVWNRLGLYPSQEKKSTKSIFLESTSRLHPEACRSLRQAYTLPADTDRCRFLSRYQAPFSFFFFPNKQKTVLFKATGNSAPTGIAILHVLLVADWKAVLLRRSLKHLWSAARVRNTAFKCAQKPKLGRNSEPVVNSKENCSEWLHGKWLYFVGGKGWIVFHR